MRLRFAPSPTGSLHVGNARTALFNWLMARKLGGKYVLRMEDTDLARSTQASIDSICTDLSWLGLDWDEGYGKGGDHGPYRQTERLGSYKAIADQLIQSGRAYLCYESEAEMEAERQEWIKEHKKERHTHRDLTPEQRAKFEAEGRKPSVRFATDDLHGEVAYDDMVRGEIKVDLAEIRDFNLMKSDGTPMYNFAVVCDDAAMKISHVIRGEDGISNTPRQLLIYQALKWEAPRFGHVSFILGPDGQKLSKRHGGGSIGDLRDRGYLPEAVLNYLGLLGLGGHGEGSEIFSLPQLIELFSSDHLIKKSAVFDFGKLDFLNGHFLRSKPLADLIALVKPTLAGWAYESEAWFSEAVDLFKGNCVHLSEFVPQFKATFRNTAIVCAEAVDKAKLMPGSKAAVTAALAEFEANFPMDAAATPLALKAAAKASGVKGKEFFMPVRLALTDSEHGPEMNRLIPLIGKERCLARLKVFLGALA